MTHVQVNQFVRPVCFAYNTSVQSSTGYTPYYLMYGREARLPVDSEFRTAATDTISPNLYVQKLQSALSYAYHIARDKLGIDKRPCLYDKQYSCMGNHSQKVTLYGCTHQSSLEEDIESSIIPGLAQIKFKVVKLQDCPPAFQLT